MRPAPTGGGGRTGVRHLGGVAALLLACLSFSPAGAAGPGGGGPSGPPSSADGGPGRDPGRDDARSGPGALVFRDVRVFDGDSVLPTADVLVRDGRIAAVGGDVEAPPGAQVLEGRGSTLLPGLIDAHVHTFHRRQLERALAFGVTTQLDMATEPAFLRRMEREQESSSAGDRADVFGAGYPATVEGGHGTQFGMDVPLVEGRRQASAWVAERDEEGSSWIKIIFESGAQADAVLPTLQTETVRRLSAAAHDRGLLVVVHVSTLAAGRDVVEAGADGLAHVWRDRIAPDSTVEWMREAGVFVIPTLSVLESATLGRGGRALARDRRLRPHVLPGTARHLGRPALTGTPDTAAFRAARISVRRLWRSGVPILAGTDAPNPGVAYGVSLHRELELLVRAGLPPGEALAAATSVPADVFGLDERGRIAPGHRADLVLVEGDPTEEITATRAIVGVWKGGERVRRPGTRRRGTARRDRTSGDGRGSGFNARPTFPVRQEAP